MKSMVNIIFREKKPLHLNIYDRLTFRRKNVKFYGLLSNQININGVRPDKTNVTFFYVDFKLNFPYTKFMAGRVKQRNI